LFRSLPEPQSAVEAQGDALPINLGLRSELYTNLEQIQIVACGTSGMLGWWEISVGTSGIPTQVQYA